MPPRSGPSPISEAYAGRINGQSSILPNLTLDPFYLTFDFVAVAAGASVQVNINVPGDSDFVWTKTVRTCTNSGGDVGQSFAPFLLTILDAGSGRQLHGPNAIHIENIAGTAALPALVPLRGRLFIRGTTISITALSQSAATLTLRLALGGYKIFGANPST